VEEVLARLDAAARSLSPRSRRWRGFLRRLPLDPDRLPRPLRSPDPGDFIICGCPRTGSSLLAAALYQPPSVVVAMEPWDGMRLPPAELFASLRREIQETGRLRRQRLDVNALRDRHEVRWATEGVPAQPVPTGEGYLLGVKWTGYWRYLELLPETRFLVCLRDPVEVVASFRSSGGRLRRGLNYDTAFNRTMNEELAGAASTFTERRVLLYRYVNERILPHLGRPTVLPVRYERWFRDPEALIAEISSFLGVRLGPLNVRLRPPEPPRVTGGEIALLRRHCGELAEALGYRLPPAPNRGGGAR
jgi:hypothetical protein